MQAMRLPFFLVAAFGHARLDVALVVGGDALEAADRDRFGFLAVVFLDAAAPAGRFAGPVAGAPEDAGEDVGLPVDHVGIGVAPCRDQPDVFGDWSVGRTGPLAIDDFMEVAGLADVGGLHLVPSRSTCRMAGECGTSHTV